MKPGPRIFPAFLSGLRSRSISAAVPVVAPAGRECGIARLRRSVAATITLSTRSRSRFRAPDAYQARSERSREGVAYDHRGRRLPRRRVGAIARSRNPLRHGSCARRPLAPPDRQNLPDRPEKLHLTRLRQDAAVRVEPAVRILLEDPLAALLVERVLLRLVAHDDGMLAERIAADDAARRGVAGLGGHGGSSSMSG